jgi:hypothetical protein
MLCPKKFFNQFPSNQSAAASNNDPHIIFPFSYSTNTQQSYEILAMGSK